MGWSASAVTAAAVRPMAPALGGSPILGQSMSIVRVNGFAVSIDGYAAGPQQSLENPLGVRGPELFQWFFNTRTWKQMHGAEGGSTGVDDEWARRGMENVGAWILGRNWPGARPVARRFMERMVGRRTALPCAGVRADTSCAAVDRDAGRDHVSLRDGRDPCGPCAPGRRRGTRTCASAAA